MRLDVQVHDVRLFTEQVIVQRGLLNARRLKRLHDRGDLRFQQHQVTHRWPAEAFRAAHFRVDTVRATTPTFPTLA